jgi:OOP family OmpA-OmpF porin
LGKVQLEKKKMRVVSMRWQIYGLVPFILLVASSCTTAKLEELRQISPEGTPFQIALAREYLAFSDLEATHYDWSDSYLFADKGLKSAYGQDVSPENPQDWDIPPDKLPELEAARADLVEALADEYKMTAQPEVAARAQYFYDCWVENQEEAWKEEEIAECREGFRSTLADYNTNTGATEDAEAAAPRTTAYMVFFDLNEWALTAEAHRVLDAVVKEILALPKVEVTIYGHTDTAGSDEYNMTLSERRAKAVQKKLVSRGIAEDDITFFAFGETDPRIPTADGIREPENRRVEIFLE